MTVGVLASDIRRAKYLAEQELGLTDYLPMADRVHGRGKALTMLLVDESAWPLSEADCAAFLPGLAYHKGQVYKIERVTDPWPKEEDNA